MTNLVEITQEYVELKGINPKPVFIAVNRLVDLCGSKSVEEYSRKDARVFVNSYKDVDLPQFSGPLINRVCSPFVCPHSAA